MSAIAAILEKEANRIARVAVAQAARTDPGGNITDVPGTRFEIWERVEAKANQWKDHTALENTTQQRRLDRGWPGLNANQTSPAVPHGHKGCGHETFIDNVEVRFAVTRPETDGEVVTIRFSVGTEPESVQYRYRSTLVAAASKRVVSATVPDGLTPGRVLWATSRIKAALT